MNIDTLGILETRWPGKGSCKTNGAKLDYVLAYLDRIILIEITAKPINIKVVQVYVL